MTQLSFPWSCTDIGDGGPTSFTVEVVEAMNRLYGNITPVDSGVVWWKDTTVLPGFTNPIGGTPSTDFFLTPDNAGGSQMSIKPGAAIVQGWVYINDDEEELSVAGGNANAVDIIGLRRDLAAQTVRLFHGQGAAASTYSLVQTSATWEIPLVEVQLDGSGNYSSHTDVRKFVATPLYPVQAHSVAVHVTRGSYGEWGTGALPTEADYWVVKPGDNDVDAPNFNGLCAGILFNLPYVSVWQFLQIPENVVGDEVDFEFVLFDRFYNALNTGQMYGTLGYVRETAPYTEVNGGMTQFPVPTGAVIRLNWYETYGTLVPVTPGEQVMFYAYRETANAFDTYPSVGISQATVSTLRMKYNRATAPTWHTHLPIQ